MSAAPHVPVLIDEVLDALAIAPGEVRKIENRSNDTCKMLVVIPYPPEV